MDKPDIMNIADQKDFWDSLQMDIMAPSRNLTNEDYRVFIERSFIFSMFFRGCSTVETIGFQKMLDLKNIGYLIILEFYEVNKADITDLLSDEFKLHLFIKKVLHNNNNAVGPLISNRISILITQESTGMYPAHKEESIAICHELVQTLEKHYQVKVKACIGSAYNIHSIYSSFIDALACRIYNRTEQIVYFPDLKRPDSNTNFDYPLVENHLLEAVRLRKIEAYDYFGMIMDYIRFSNDDIKRNMILEILVLANHSIRLDSQKDLKQIDYIGCSQKLMSLNGDSLIDYAYQRFIYITSYVKQQNSIDYSNHIVMATKEYLENHYTDDISLENMADYVNISPQYLSKLIKKTTGFNFIDWLSMFRVKKAKELLTNPNLTVKEVCFMVGYKDPNYFSRIFRKRIGITPSEYVKANSFLSNKS